MKHPYLRNCFYNKALKLSNNKFIHNYCELASEITSLDDEEFNKYVGKGYDDFSEWIKENYDDNCLLNKLKEVTDKKKYAAVIEKRIKELEKEPKKKSVVLLMVVIILAVVLVIETTFIKYQEYQNDEYSRVLIQKISDGAYQDMIYQYKLDDLDTQKKALEERVKVLENEKLVINSKETSVGPDDRISEQQIRISGNNVILYVSQGPVIGEIAGTGSMLPSLTAYSHVIEILPQQSVDIKSGDIIAYKLNEETLIHRVIEIGNDEQGWYAVTKGDNSLKPDADKVRFAQVKKIVVAIIY